MNKQDMMNLLHHVITVGRHWHLEYARLFVHDNQYQQVVKDRNQFDKDLLKKGEDIINGIERKSEIVKVTILFNGYKQELTTDEYTSNQLRQIIDCLEENKDIETQNSIKKLFIEKDEIIGFEVTYKSEYDNIFTKNKQEEQA